MKCQHREFTYPGDKVSKGEGDVAAVTAEPRFHWIKCWGCAEFLCRKRFPLKLKESVFKSYVRQTILYWCCVVVHEASGDRHLEDKEIDSVGCVCSTAWRLKKSYGLDYDVDFQ